MNVEVTTTGAIVMHSAREPLASALAPMVRQEIDDLRRLAPHLPMPEMRIDNIAAMRSVIEGLTDPVAACVEIGTYLGGSLRYLLHRLSAAGKCLPIYCVDRQITSEAMAVKRELDVLSMVTFLKDESKNVAEAWNLPIQYLLIDATHLYEAVTSDIELWTPFVIPGGCILFHDFDRHGFPGVVRAVNEFAERHHLSVDDWNGMALIRMPPD